MVLNLSIVLSTIPATEKRQKNRGGRLQIRTRHVNYRRMSSDDYERSTGPGVPKNY